MRVGDVFREKVKSAEDPFGDLEKAISLAVEPELAPLSPPHHVHSRGWARYSNTSLLGEYFYTYEPLDMILKD
ncbi:hypothetical protein TNCV_2499971 [Trichonephila clavipes]|nr:hypothetical protein TNCV_2499971 [Trichonephila clavipes]